MMSRFVTALLALVAAALGGRAARMAYADELRREGTLESLRRAASLEPSDASLLAQLAVLDRDAATPLLTEAIRLDPADASLRIALGHVEEGADRLPRAEQEFLRAAELDRGYDPRWALANFYLRRGKDRQFRNWLRQAAAFGLDPEPVIRLCRRAGLSCQDTVELLPAHRIPRAEFLDKLLADGDLSAADYAAEALESVATAADASRLLSLVESLIAANEIEKAVSHWNRLVDRNVLGFARLDRKSLINADFRTSPSGRGFDWRLISAPGIRYSKAPQGLEIQFERDRVASDLLLQFTPLEPDTRYALQIVLETQPPALARCLEWRLLDGVSGRAIRTQTSNPNRYEFATTAETRYVRLLLSYWPVNGISSSPGTLILVSTRLYSLEREAIFARRQPE